MVEGFIREKQCFILLHLSIKIIIFIIFSFIREPTHRHLNKWINEWINGEFLWFNWFHNPFTEHVFRLLLFDIIIISLLLSESDLNWPNIARSNNTLTLGFENWTIYCHNRDTLIDIREQWVYNYYPAQSHGHVYLNALAKIRTREMPTYACAQIVYLLVKTIYNIVIL